MLGKMQRLVHHFNLTNATRLTAPCTPFVVCTRAASKKGAATTVAAKTSSNGNGAVAKLAAGKSKEDRIRDVHNALNKKFGQGTMLIGNEIDTTVDFVPTGIVTLDVALGGGIPRGRYIEVYGPEASGKTTLALAIAAQYQARGEAVAYVDMECALSTQQLQRVGIDTMANTWAVVTAENMESALNVVDDIIRADCFGLIVVDSVAAMSPSIELSSDVGTAQMAVGARVLGQALRKSQPYMKNTTVLFINQIRHKVGVMFGSPEVTPGGQALKYAASQRIDVRKIADLKGEKDKPSGIRMRFKIKKNKVAPPFREAEADLDFVHGFNKVASLVEAGRNLGVIEASGAWLSYDGVRLGQGATNAGNMLLENQELYKKIEGQVFEAMRSESAIMSWPIMSEADRQELAAEQQVADEAELSLDTDEAA